MQSIHSQLVDAGVALFSVSPQLQSILKTTQEEDQLEYDLLSDLGNGYARTLGLVFSFPEDLKQIYLAFGINLAANNGDESWELALPSTLLIDKELRVRYISSDPDYTVRPEPEDLLTAVNDM